MRAVALISVFVLSACTAPGGDADFEGPQDEPTQAAEQTLRIMAQAQFPGQDAGKIAQCGILNSTDEELQTLANGATETDAFLGRAAAAGVFAKPQTRACLTANGIAL